MAVKSLALLACGVWVLSWILQFGYTSSNPTPGIGSRHFSATFWESGGIVSWNCACFTRPLGFNPAMTPHGVRMDRRVTKGCGWIIPFVSFRAQSSRGRLMAGSQTKTDPEMQSASTGIYFVPVWKRFNVDPPQRGLEDLTQQFCNTLHGASLILTIHTFDERFSACVMWPSGRDRALTRICMWLY